jgi:predicted metal-dependent HD superfamily phosphohydrolase
MKLSSRWCQLLDRFSPDEKIVVQVFQEIVSAYSQPHRYYHTLAHIRHCLGILGTMRSDSLNCSALELAVWFHDIVYNPQANDNEQQSADYAAIVLPQLKIPPATLSEVKRLILCTQFHQTQDDDREGQILVDADLAILGTRRSQYREYALAIRQEYAWVAESDYCRGRQKVLNKFLQHDRIYKTQFLRSKLESRARSNLTMELRELSESTDSGGG